MGAIDIEENNSKEKKGKQKYSQVEQIHMQRETHFSKFPSNSPEVVPFRSFLTWHFRYTRTPFVLPSSFRLQLRYTCCVHACVCIESKLCYRYRSDNNTRKWNLFTLLCAKPFTVYYGAYIGSWETKHSREIVKRRSDEEQKNNNILHNGYR